MVLTALEGRVAPERATALQDAYDGVAVQALPPGFIRSQLVRSAADPTLWRIETLWRSRGALDAMRGQGTPAGVLIFRAASAEPTLTIFDLVREIPS
jgi:quinol monooxygenase YgiN